MSNKLHLLLFGLLMTLGASSAFSFATTDKSWLPKSDDELVIIFDNAVLLPLKLKDLSEVYHQDKNNLTAALNLIDGYFSIANLPGNSRYYDSAEIILAGWLSHERFKTISAEQVVRVNLTHANLLQQRHEFIQSNLLLEKIPKTSNYYSQALLVLSRSHLILGNISTAEKQCRLLLTQGALGLAELCILENLIVKGEANKSYSRLLNIEKRSDHLSLSTKIWLYQLLGSAAHQLDENVKSQQWFSFQLNTAPVSQWLLWSNIAFINRDYTQIYQRINQLAQTNNLLEDSLLLRLARAEKNLVQQDNKWQQVVAQRMQLRLLRKDEQHAADLAYYFIYINKNPSEALNWAEINWLSAKEPEDEKLLKLAQTIYQQEAT